MPRRTKGTKQGKNGAEVWVSSDLMVKLKGAEGNRGLPLPQSPYLTLADKFLGLNGDSPTKPHHKNEDDHSDRQRQATRIEESPRVLAAVVSGSPVVPQPPSVPRGVPPGRLKPPKPPHVEIPRFSRPKPPKLNYRKPNWP